MITALTKELVSKRMAIYLLVGTIATTIDILLFNLLFYVALIPILIANTTSYLTASISNFFLHRRFTFPDGKKKSLNRIPISLTFSALGLLLNTLAVIITMTVFKAFTAKLIATAITLLYNYITKKYIVFVVR